MCQTARIFMLQRLKGSMSGDARFRQHGDASCHQVFFFHGTAPKEINTTVTETLGEHAPSYVTVKKCVAQFKLDDFSNCVMPRPGRPKIVTTPEIIDQFTG